MLSRFSETRALSYVSLAVRPEFLWKDWRGKSCWPHLLESGPEVDQGPSGVTTSPISLCPVLVSSLSRLGVNALSRLGVNALSRLGVNALSRLGVESVELLEIDVCREIFRVVPGLLPPPRLSTEEKRA